jgi:16S rRNA (uracil1498-N3)-methyltransferase
MNIILLFPEDFIAGDRVRLDGRRAAHIRGVHRAAVGSALRVGLIDDRIGTGVVRILTPTHVEIEVGLADAPPPPLPLTLMLALPRPKVLKRTLQAVTALGVKRIILVNSVRVEKSYWLSPLLAPQALREQLVLGLEQACDTVLPDVALRQRFKPFVEDEIGAVVSNHRALVAHPAAAEPCPRADGTPIFLAVGPEGGFVQYEIDLLTMHGFHPVSLGLRRLRVEQVIPALIGRLF